MMDSEGDGRKQCILIGRDSALKTTGHRQATTKFFTSAGSSFTKPPQDKSHLKFKVFLEFLSTLMELSFTKRPSLKIIEISRKVPSILKKQRTQI